MKIRTLALLSLAATAGMFVYSRPAEPVYPYFRDAPGSSAREEFSALARSGSLSAIKPVVVAAAEDGSGELRVFREPGEKEADAAKPVSWLGQRCFDSGCLSWAANTGTVWNGEQCAAGGCTKWVSNTGVIWNGRRCSGAGCMDWAATNGGSWSGEDCADNGCLKWTSDTGRVLKGRRCLEAGCRGWSSNTEIVWNGGRCTDVGCVEWTTSTPDELFLPFLNRK